MALIVSYINFVTFYMILFLSKMKITKFLYFNNVRNKSVYVGKILLISNISPVMASVFVITLLKPSLRNVL